MGLANRYSRIIRRQLKRDAAWLPVTNIFTLGDFGVVSGGIFNRIGNISDLGISWKEKDGAASKLDFSSRSISSTGVKADANVDIPNADTSVAAKLIFEFKRKHTFVLKAAKLTSKEIDNIFEVAAALHEHARWRLRYRFVTAVYTAENPLMLASREGSTKVTLSGHAEVLKQVELGDFGAGINVSSNKELGLEILGGSGVISLGLAKVSPFGDTRPLERGGTERRVGVEFDTDWEDDIEDDL